MFFLRFAFAVSGVSNILDASGCEQHWSLIMCLMNVMLFFFKNAAELVGGKC